MEPHHFDADLVHAAGLTLLGEPIAVDLVNTEKVAGPVPIELLPNDEANSAFWVLERERMVVPAQLPSLERVRALRSAVRSLLESRIAADRPETWALESLNRFAFAAPVSPALTGDWSREIAPHASDEATALLGVVARSAIDVLAGPDADRLRRCAADDCSMLFIATNAKRQWCTAAGCGNRQRVARHANRQRSAPATRVG